MKRIAPILILASFGLISCAVNPTGGRDLVLMSEKKEIALGAQIHREVMREFGRYPNEEVQDFVDRIGQDLARVSHRQNLDFHFTVLDDDIVNAMALPGGYIYVTRGMLAHLENEAQLAAVIGHEIGHVTGRHAVRQHGRGSVLGVLGQAASAVTGVPGTNVATDVLSAGIMSGYGRKMELEADELGAEYLARVNYNVDAMIDVIEVLKQKEKFEIDRAEREGREPRVNHGFFASHPDNETRWREVVEAADQYRTEAPRQIDDRDYLLRLNGLDFGVKGMGGTLRGNTYYHDGLGMKVTFPRGWLIDNKEDRISSYTHLNDITIQLQVHVLNRKMRPRDFMITGLKVTGIRDGKDVTIDGMPGFIAISESAKTPYGDRPARYAVIIDEDRSLAYTFAGASKATLTLADADRFFVPAIFSFGRMKQADYRASRPQEVRILRANENTTFEKLAETSPITNYPEEQLRLINNMYPDGEPQPGQLIKIVR